MFLHVLLFFLLGTSVLGAPAKRPTEVAQAAGGHPQPVVEALAQKLHVGLWHPIKAGVGINVVSRISLIFSQVPHPYHSHPN